MSPTPRSRPAVRALVLAALVAATSGCGLLGKKDTPPQYAPRALAGAASLAPGPARDWQLVIAPVQVARPYDSLRIAVRPTSQELQVYKGGTWAERPGEMVERVVMRTLDSSGRLRAVARAGSGVSGDYRLLLDVRRFEADYAGQAVPSATIEVAAQLLEPRTAEVVATRTFLQAEPAAGTAVPEVVDAFDRALGRMGHEVGDWVLASGRGTR